MDFVRKTYVLFIYPGVFLNEGSIQEVNSRDVESLRVPKRAFGFKFFDILSAVVEYEGKEFNLESKQINVSPMHYYGGKLYTLSQLKSEFPNAKILIRNVELFKFWKTIHVRTSNWQPFNKTDIFIDINKK